MRRGGRRLGALAVTLVLSASRGDALGRYLEVVNSHARAVLSLPVAEGEAFDLAFTHSSERCRWIHQYRVSLRGIEQVASVFAAFGPGMPTAPPAGMVITRVDGGFRVPAPAVLGEVPMIYSSNANIRIGYRGTSLSIGDRLADLESFRLRVR